MTRLTRALPALVGLCLLAALLYLAGGTDVLAAVRRCTPAAILGAVAALVAGTVLGAWNVYRIAGLQAAMPFDRFLPVYWRSWAAGITVPGQVGDMLAMLWQLRGHTVSLSFITGRLLADKAVSLSAMLGLAAMLPVVTGQSGMLLSIVLLSVLAVAVVVGYASLRWCVRHPALVPRLRWSGRLQSALAAAVELPSGTVALNAVVTIAKISFFGLAYWFLLFTMAPKPPSFSATVVISQSVGLVAYLPISFNGIGTVEISAITLFRAIDLDAAAVLSVYLTMRAITLVTAWLPTAWLMLRKPAVAG